MNSNSHLSHRPYWRFLAIGILLVTGSANADESTSPIQPYAVVSLEAWSLIDGGVSTGERSMGMLDTGIDFALSEAIEGHVGFIAFGGDRDIDAFTGDFGAYSNLITDSKAILFTAWLQHRFDLGSLRYGQLAVDESFIVSETGSLFINSNYGAPPSLSANAPSPIYSVGAGGIEWFGDLESGNWQMGLYAGDPGPGDRDDHGVNWKAGGNAGYFAILERSWRYGEEDSSGVFKIGGYYHSGQFDTLESGIEESGNYAAYAVLDHAFDDRSSAFVRAGYNPKSDRSVVRSYIDFGWAFNGLFGSSLEDRFGIAYSYTAFSRPYRLSRAADAISSSEEVIEFTYAAPLIDQWEIQPSFQWIIDSHEANRDAFLIGLRLSAGF